MDTYPWRLAAAGLIAVVIGLVIFGLLAAMPAGFETSTRLLIMGAT